jgi:hypothetical protein
MFYKSNLVYVAEDFRLPIGPFIDYCQHNFSEYVWEVFDGVVYCHSNDAGFLAGEYREFLEKVSRYV